MPRMERTPISASFTSALMMALALTLLPSIPARAEVETAPGAVEITDSGSSQAVTTRTPKAGTQVGRKAAEKYMGPHRTVASSAGAGSGASSITSDSHYLAIHVGAFISDNAYKWGGTENATDVGRLNAGVSYRIGEWVNSMDLLLRVDFSQYSLAEGRANKLSFLPVITFPDAASKFPLYFGAGLGGGIFMNQLSQESPLSLDYQLLAGARFFDLFGNTGLFVEGGLKNHFLLLSDGQYNGAFATVGGLFTF